MQSKNMTGESYQALLKLLYDVNGKHMGHSVGAARVEPRFNKKRTKLKIAGQEMTALV
jgi:hypothetical protein